MVVELKRRKKLYKQMSAHRLLGSYIWKRFPIHHHFLKIISDTKASTLGSFDFLRFFMQIYYICRKKYPQRNSASYYFTDGADFWANIFHSAYLTNTHYIYKNFFLE